MGNREDLLAAAMECLRTKGYARTTARDITEIAGTSLAAIGYHYGGIRNLLNQAVYAAIEQWSDREQARLRTDAPSEEAFLERFGAVWASTIEGFQADREVWAASFDLMTQVDHVPEIREQLRRGMQAARTGNVAMFEGVDEDTVSEEQARTVGSLYYAIQAGVVIQWLIDPDSAPSADDIVAGLRAIAAKAAEEA
ncbi:transcriptional regulator, TetR family [Saccharopolyspora kobensis]|uniref:Transcriptional regulator, TetR family n=1 Tax=Saccharopolyspora kobensis TaxID=146035 RepID=A0A1H6DRK7_9PSEU|nr:TetR/AcrR family transcriptional regulator [Saccharopolyspora kobensis]SEG87714.1 transcriptional regulator, TetR family [Saccharopolyspora kobensis]SFE05441.1 transcriptional regulator, TetR family [Saccharopolyspora kobensis]